jgi:type II secretory ATPase GspE/PulE/Tfp pilus assembly ATPase PilB-like protein
VVRYRVEGELKLHPKTLPPEYSRPLMSRLKLLAKLDITETRRPQDGRITVRANKRYIDLRISSVPTKLGEKIVLRILDPTANARELSHLFAVDKVRQLFREMVYRPHGLVLVTGPTGSGKTTTLYTALLTRNRPELNIVTVEDPIEYHMDGVTQIQVRPEAGATFARLLRALLRQDPDVILVRETRDRETADVAVEAAMTGHLVLTSVHTNSALDAVLRLVDLGVERYALANALVGVVHQRLVRRLCSRCAAPFTYPEPIVERLREAGACPPREQPKLYRAKGCDQCRNTGYHGRIGVFELLVVNDAIRTAIATSADQSTLREIAMRGSMISLARYGGSLLSSGLTTPGEVLPLVRSIGS